MKTLFSMLKQNLGKAQMLTYVFVFNTPSWVEELEFIYGTNDKEQWKVIECVCMYTTIIKSP